MKYLLVTLAVLFCTFSCYAGDYANFKHLGFSESGQYYAFAQSGTGDGSGLAYAEVMVIDVKKNEVVSSGTFDAALAAMDETKGNDGNEENALNLEETIAKAIAIANPGKYGIVADKCPGEDYLLRLPTDHSKTSEIVFSTMFAAEGGATPQNTRYAVKLETKAGECPIKDMPTEFGAAQLLKLSVNWTEEEKAKSLVIQDDKSLPLNRAYPLGYTVRRINGYNGGLIVVVSYETPGFEGPNVRYMVFGCAFDTPMG